MQKKNKSKTFVKAPRILSLLRFHTESQQVWAKEPPPLTTTEQRYSKQEELREERGNAKQKSKEEKDSTEGTYRRYSWSSDLRRSHGFGETPFLVLYDASIP